MKFKEKYSVIIEYTFIIFTIFGVIIFPSLNFNVFMTGLIIIWLLFFYNYYSSNYISFSIFKYIRVKDYKRKNDKTYFLKIFIKLSVFSIILYYLRSIVFLRNLFFGMLITEQLIIFLINIKFLYISKYSELNPNHIEGKLHLNREFLERIIYQDVFNLLILALLFLIFEKSYFAAGCFLSLLLQLSFIRDEIM